MSYNDGEIKIDDYPQKVSFRYNYLIQVTKKGNVFSVQYPPNEELESNMHSEDLTELYPFTALDLKTWEESCLSLIHI